MSAAEITGEGFWSARQYAAARYYLEEASVHARRVAEYWEANFPEIPSIDPDAIHEFLETNGLPDHLVEVFSAFSWTGDDIEAFRQILMLMDEEWFPHLSAIPGEISGIADTLDQVVAEMPAAVAEHFVDIRVDLKPGSDPNPVNRFRPGLIPVGILGSDVFDVADVDVTTLAFGPEGATPAHQQGGHLQEVNDDGFTDLLSHYRTQKTGIGVGDTEACVTGKTLDGIPFEGCDNIVTEPPCGNGYAAALVVPGLVWMGRRSRRRKS